MLGRGHFVREIFCQGGLSVRGSSVRVFLSGESSVGGVSFCQGDLREICQGGLSVSGSSLRGTISVRGILFG